MSSYHKVIRCGAVIGMWGFILSGPVAVLLVMLLHPQPKWISPLVFVEAYHPLQIIPYVMGLGIIIGMVMLTTGHFLASREQEEKIHLTSTWALIAILLFTSLITFNYICQISFVHNIARHYRPEYAPLIAGFSMSNPTSLSWAIEMWGYAFLSIGLWLLAPFYQEKSRLLTYLLAGNVIISLISPVWTILDPEWVETPQGIGLFLFWNLWMIILMVMFIRLNPLPQYKSNA